MFAEIVGPMPLIASELGLRRLVGLDRGERGGGEQRGERSDESFQHEVGLRRMDGSLTTAARGRLTCGLDQVEARSAAA